MQTKYKKEDKLLIIKISEEIDHCNSEKIRKKADYEIQIHIPKKVVFDFSEVNFMDSSGIGMIIGRYKLVSMLGGNVLIANVKPAIKKILEMSGILKLIKLIEMEEEKVEEFI